MRLTNAGSGGPLVSSAPLAEDVAGVKDYKVMSIAGVEDGDTDVHNGDRGGVVRTLLIRVGHVRLS